MSTSPLSSSGPHVGTGEAWPDDAVPDPAEAESGQPVLADLIARAGETALAASALGCLDRCLPLLGSTDQVLRPLWVSLADGTAWEGALAEVRQGVRQGVRDVNASGEASLLREASLPRDASLLREASLPRDASLLREASLPRDASLLREGSPDLGSVPAPGSGPGLAPGSGPGPAPDSTPGSAPDPVPGGSACGTAAALARHMLDAVPAARSAGALRSWADTCSATALRIHRLLDAGDDGMTPLVAAELRRQIRVLELLELLEADGDAVSGGLRQVLDVSTEGRRVLRAVVSRSRRSGVRAGSDRL